MKVKAKVNFSGNKLSMCVGDVKEVSESIAKDLLRAGYIEEIKPAEKAKTVKGKSDKTEKGA